MRAADSVAEARALVLARDGGPGLPGEPVHQFQCRDCRKTSRASEGDPLLAEVWALKHTRLHPAHRAYCAVTTSFWRVDPDPGAGEEAGR
ncbi:DUF7848 domain-containing protein [Streptomyces huiliensis]|uniref:DUF7848 domain-containing protein n=1 Tax=Streptomyces huiliensis TaxID=2876027 RepID=UPI001CBD1A8C|nr:hypothetical protein [Streptomyces huiliensis]MBZ4318090.1 hypothetical protein [Streptomyces huiliensis]